MTHMNIHEGQTLRQALLLSGWQALDSRTHPRVYADTFGTRFGTLEKDCCRIALSLGQELTEERGDAIVYMSDEPRDVILRALITDPDCRGQGLAIKALKEIEHLADATASTIYLEPQPIDDKPVAIPILVALYARFGFVFTSAANRVMARPPRVVMPT